MEQFVIQEIVEHEITQYIFYKDSHEIGNIQLSKSTEMIEQVDDEETPVIRIRYIYVEEPFRGKGYSKKMIAYGLSMFRDKYPDIQFSALDDDSDAANTPYQNIYWKFGYVPKDTYRKNVNQTGELPKYLKQEQCEMILDFDSSRFKKMIHDI